MNPTTPYPTSPNEPLANPTSPGSGPGTEHPPEVTEPTRQPIHEPVPSEPIAPALT